MRARRSISALEAALALPDGADRDDFFQRMEAAFGRLGGPTIQREVIGCEQMQRHFERVRPTGDDLPYNRDRQRMTSALHRHVQLLNNLRERAAELARADFYGMHGRDALASLPPWLQEAATGARSESERPQPEPLQQSQGRPQPEPARASAGSNSEPAPVPAEATSTTAPSTADNPDPEGQQQPVSGRYVKGVLKSLRDKGVSHNALMVLRDTARLRPMTKAEFRETADALARIS